MNTAARFENGKRKRAGATIGWLLRREFWEHKGAMLWAPLVVAALLVVVLGGAVTFALSHHALPNHVFIGNQELPPGALADTVTAEARMMIAQIAAANYVAFTSPLLVIVSGVCFFYCLGALYDERRDRSILFWKSLPVSDGMTVLSKALTALFVAPAMTIVLIAASSLIVLLLACATLAVRGANVFPDLLATSSLYLSPLYLLALVPVFAVWALPTVGWLMLVSSWARTKPFLWAVLMPLFALLVVKWVSLALGGFGQAEHELMHFAGGVVARMLGGLAPGIWFTFDGIARPASMHMAGQGIMLGDVVAKSWLSLTSTDAWIGAAGGVAMLAGAARLRRWRDEA